jgi:hypothetical protein
VHPAGSAKGVSQQILTDLWKIGGLKGWRDKSESSLRERCTMSWREVTNRPAKGIPGTREYEEAITNP